MDGDYDQLMYIPDEIDTSRLRFKSGSGDQYCHTRLRAKSGSKRQHGIINRLRGLLVDLSKEALSDMNFGRNQRAKELLKLIIN